MRNVHTVRIGNSSDEFDFSVHIMYDRKSGVLSSLLCYESDGMVTAAERCGGPLGT
jgi:hypothetical protein